VRLLKRLRNRLELLWRLINIVGHCNRLDDMENAIARLEGMLTELDEATPGWDDLPADRWHEADFDELQRQVDNLRAFTAPLHHSHEQAAS
jgi:hypothetical protein